MRTAGCPALGRKYKQREQDRFVENTLERVGAVYDPDGDSRRGADVPSTEGGTVTDGSRRRYPAGGNKNDAKPLSRPRRARSRVG